jgi:hypothetical protein
MLNTQIEKLKHLIDELCTHTNQLERSDKNVSASPVGWHIQHTLMATNRIITAIQKSDPAEYKRSFNLKRTFVLTMNKMPRGKAKAPDTVLPQGDITENGIREYAVKVYQKIESLNTLLPNNFFPHPYFGKLNLKPSLKVLVIHTQHHLNIINDILKNK